MLLGVALLVAPLLRGAHHLFPAFLDMDDTLASSLAMVGGGALLAALVLLRFVFLLRRARRLAEVASVTLDVRTRLLSESQSRYRSLVEQLPAITLLLTLRDDGTVQPLYVSPQTEAILGVSPSTWLADFDSVKQRIHPTTFRASAKRSPTSPAATRRPRSSSGPRARTASRSGSGTSAPWSPRTPPAATSRRCCSTSATPSARRPSARRWSWSCGSARSSKRSASSPPASRTRSTRRRSSSATRVRFLRDAFVDLMQLQDIQSELHAAAEAGDVTPELLKRVREAEDAADLDYLRNRVPGAFDRADEGIARVGAIVSAMRDFGHPPTAERAPVQLNDALRNTLRGRDERVQVRVRRRDRARRSARRWSATAARSTRSS